MSAVAQAPNGRTGLLSRLIPNELTLRVAYVWTGVLGLITAIIFPLHLQDRLPYNTLPSLPLAFFAVLGAVAIRGRAVLRRTPLDWVMLAWIVLTILSQMNAWLFLHRNMFEHEVVNVLLVLINMWLLYRAFFAFTIVHPQSAVRATIFWLILVIAFCAVIGILQSVGPIQSQMVAFAYKVGVGENAIKLGASEITSAPRTTSVFSGPNIFGFINLIAGCLLIGSAMAYRHKMRELQGVIIVASLGFFAYANLNSQSRFTFVLAALLAVVFLIYLIKAAKWRALLTSAILFVILVVTVVVLTSQGNYSYLTGIFETGYQRDFSYLARVQGMERLFRIAGDIPVLGVGQDYYSLVMYGRGDFYSKANGAGDNGLLTAYFLMGLPGVLHLFFLNFVAVRALKKLKTENRTFLAAMRNSGWVIFWLYIITIPYAIRFHKFETMVYWLMVFGVVFGLVSVQSMRDQRLRELGLTADDMYAEDELSPRPSTSGAH